MGEHPIQQPIRAISIDSIPYVRVWKGEVCEAEFCQHNIVGVYFGSPE